MTNILSHSCGFAIARHVRRSSASTSASTCNLRKPSFRTLGVFAHAAHAAHAAQSPHGRSTITPQNEAQRLYSEHLRDPGVAMVIAAGAAGSGKTLLAVDAALNALQTGDVRRIVMARPAVSAGEELGFLPGSVEEKMRPWLAPLYDALNKRLSPGAVRSMVDGGKLELCPIAHMRGRTFEDAFVVVDEAQNATESQFRMIVTRIGLGAKIVLAGDPSQVDLATSSRSGLIDFLERYDHATALPTRSGVRVVRLVAEDCVRHPVVREMLALYGPP